MLKKHQELLDQLQKTEALTVAIEKDGGNLQGLIHQLRSGIASVKIRVQAYKDQEVADAEAKAKAEAEAKAKAEAEAKAKAEAAQKEPKK